MYTCTRCVCVVYKKHNERNELTTSNIMTGQFSTLFWHDKYEHVLLYMYITRGNSFHSFLIYFGKFEVSYIFAIVLYLVHVHVTWYMYMCMHMY